MEDQIRYQPPHPPVLGQKGEVKLSRTIEDLSLFLKRHFGEETGEPGLQEPPRKRARHEDCDPEVVSDSELEAEVEPFSYSTPGQPVAVYYDHDFYLCRVISVTNKETATVQFLQRTTTRLDHFKWPAVEDVAETSAHFVFRWDLGLIPVSSDGRVWKVDDIEDIIQGYTDIKRRANLQ